LGPYIMLATALVLLGMAAWLWELGEARGEPARLLLVWIAFSAVTALIAAAGMWIEDASMGQSFTAASRTYYMIAAFILFLFARSFSVGIDFTVLYWSVPLQLGLAGIIINWQSMFELRGGAWVLDLENPAAILIMAVTLLYDLLALIYAVILYLTLRREGRQKEKGRSGTMVAAVCLLFLASATGSVVGGESGYVAGAVFLFYIAGVLLLIWAFRGPFAFRTVER